MTTPEIDRAVAPAAAPATALSRARAPRVPIAWVQLGVLLGALVVYPFVRTVDPDLWWHLRTGQIVLHSGIPTHDPFSWTAAGKPWVAHEWLSEVAIYAVESMFGFWANALVFGAIACSALLLMYRLGRESGAGTKPLVLFMYLSAAVFAEFVTVRPQEFTWLLFAVFVYLIQRHYSGRGAPVWALPLLMALWANLHLGFTYGLVLTGAWIAASGFDIVRGREADLRTPLLVTSACLLAACLNPHGARELLYPLRYVTDHRITANVGEWRRASPTVPLHWPILLVDLALALSLVSRTRPRPFLALVTILAIALSLEAVRNAPLAALLLVPVAGAAAAERWRVAGRAGDSSTKVSLALAIVLILAVGFGTAQVGLRYYGTLSLTAPSQEGYPAAEAAYVREHYAGKRLLNAYGDGGFLIYALYPDAKVSIDGRGDFYGGDAMDEYATLYQARDGWRDVLARLAPEVALLPKQSPIAKALVSDAGWKQVFDGKDDAVFVPGQTATN